MDIHYVHDALGRRIGKIRDGNLETGWLYADALNPIAELDSAGNIEATFVYGTRAHVHDAMVMADGTVYRFITDHLGSVRLVVNAQTGAVAQRIDYDAFGRVLQDTSPGFQPFGFAGGLYDDDTGLVRFGARDYDAVAGRWTAKDPILFGGRDPNLYSYVQNDPVNALDRLGWFLERIWSDWGERGANAGQAVHHYTFTDYARGRSLSELQHMGDGSAVSAAGPARFRYVNDPADPSQITDMRHFLVVGPQGEGVGLLIEAWQQFGGDSYGDPDSAFDAQDFFSNALGAEFFKQYDPELPLDEQLDRFFNARLRSYQCD